MDTYQIESLGHHGDGIARGPVFAPMTLPGEVVSGTLQGDRLAELRILEPSPLRVAAPCRHFRSCGGCAVQHAGDDFVADWKRGIVEEALRRQGLGFGIGSVLTSPPRSRRRAVLSARRTKQGALAGFHGRASGSIVEISHCQLLLPGLMAGLPAARAVARSGAARKGEISVKVSLSDGGLDVEVTGGKPLDEALRLSLTEVAQAQDLARLSWEGEVVVTRRPPSHQMGPARVVPPPGAFLQATREGEAALRDAVLSVTRGAKRVADLFAGCGTFALPLSAGTEVHAVEGNAAMIEALALAWRKAGGLHRLTTARRDLFRDPLTAEELAGFDAVVIDPPRAGAAAQVAQIAAAQVPVVAHVSCNPVTFARDARALVEAGYVMGPVTVVDQFRWSPHVEVVAGFTLTSA
ncbi:class I SAM-dependent RNA methyltransferase [Pseudooceanicola aestuarii]|uniref:class I SAM-dependent RNA methyltransferase n=1 Tax=Pseudooceanicola aestuarii TaxID=2697319 RepID=UPI0013D6A5DD|nr:class I SAM-dependent RNA methyltransferase [Pseudooceanicola aestuarii]